jgi:hypothetical protein
MRQHIDGIGREQQQSAGILLHYFWDDLPPNGSILFDQIQPGFARFLSRARCQDRDRRSGTIGIISGPHSSRMREWHGMVEIHGLAFCLGAISVDEHDFRCKAA